MGGEGRKTGGENTNAFQKTMKLENEELLLYFGCLDEAKTASDVAEKFYKDKKDSVRTSISRKKAIQSLLEKGLIEATKKDTWVYKANENKLAEVLETLLTSEDISENFRDLQTINFEQASGNMNKLIQIPGFRSFFSEDRMSYILPNKLSDVRKTLSTYTKILFVVLTGMKKLLCKLEAEGKLEGIKNGKISFNEEKFSQIGELASSMTFSDEESQLTVATVFRAISESKQIDVREIPDVNDEEIEEIAEMSFRWVDYVMEDREDLFESNQNTARA